MDELLASYGLEWENTDQSFLYEENPEKLGIVGYIEHRLKNHNVSTIFWRPRLLGNRLIVVNLDKYVEKTKANPVIWMFQEEFKDRKIFFQYDYGSETYKFSYGSDVVETVAEDPKRANKLLPELPLKRAFDAEYQNPTKVRRVVREKIYALLNETKPEIETLSQWIRAEMNHYFEKEDARNQELFKLAAEKEKMATKRNF